MNGANAMEHPELSVEDAYDVLLSWSQTLVNTVKNNKTAVCRSVSDVRAVLEEVVPAVGYLEDAIRREQESSTK
jgi:hypothetical protein